MFDNNQEIQFRHDAMKQQRDALLDEVVALYAKAKLFEAENESLRSQITKLQALREASNLHPPVVASPLSGPEQ